jgi:hypothetical protein
MPCDFWFRRVLGSSWLEVFSLRRTGLVFWSWICANQECATVVHLFLKYVPTLRILQALGVPVDDAGLVGSDWACKGLEILLIINKKGAGTIPSQNLGSVVLEKME